MVWTFEPTIQYKAKSLGDKVACLGGGGRVVIGKEAWLA
jgi:hypothetical protein